MAETTKGAKTMSRARLEKMREELDAKLKAGAITPDAHKAGVEQIAGFLGFMEEQPTREVDSTVKNVQKYAELAGLTEKERAEVDEIAGNLNAGIKRLRELIGKVEVERKNKAGETVKGKPLPRWFCNVVVPTGKDSDSDETAESTPTAEEKPKGKGKRSK